jgi:glycosyltransferase involved in cell wall biosynthesis
MNRLRIGYVVQRYGLEVNGGSEVHCRLLAERLARFHDVDVLTTCAIDYVTWRDEYPEGVTSLNGVSVRRFNVDYPRNNNLFNEISSRVFGGPHTEEDEIEWMKLQGPYSSKLLAWLEEHRTAYNVFIFQTYLYCTTFFGLPIVSDRAVLVSTAHDEPPIYLAIFERLFQKARYLLYLTPEERAFLKRRFFASELQGEVVGLGLESGKAPEPCLEWDRIQQQIGSSPYLLYVGRIDESKGCGTLIEYFARYVTETANSDLKLVMLGKAAMAVPAHAQLVTPGFVSENAKMQALHACSLMLIPSPYESLSIVALEAWQFEKPVLVNGDCAVLRGQCIRSNGGLWYSSYAEFGETLTYLLNDRAMAETIGRQGGEFVRQNYLWEPVEKRLNSILHRVALPSPEREVGLASDA